MDPTERRFLDEAVALATASVGAGGGPFGALVVRGGRVVGRGQNRVALERDPSAHAEVVALRDAGRNEGSHDLSGAVLYSSCEPCPMCHAAVLWARVERVVYAAGREAASAAGFDDARVHTELTTDPGARSLPMHAASCPGADAPFAAWLAKADRIEY